VIKKLEADSADCCEANSQITFKPLTRKVNDDQLKAIVGARKYISLDSVERIGRDAAFE